MEETREHRSDETAEQQTAEGHVQGVEQAVDRGLLNRKQADRVIRAGQKAHGSHDMARSVRQRDGVE